MKIHSRQQFASILIASFVFATTLSAQNVPIPVTAEEASGGFNTGPVVPVGLSVPARVMQGQLKIGKNIPSGEPQIRVTIRYVMLDDETRKKIYHDIGTEKLKTVGSKVPSLHADYTGVESADTRGTEVIAKSSRVTTSILNEPQMRALMEAVGTSPDSQLTRAPSVVLIDGVDTEVKDLVQRPFLIDLQRQGQGDQQTVEPVAQVLNEGISIRLNASLTPSQRIHVKSDLVFEKILGIEEQEVFGISDEPTSVQVPIHQRKVVTATENLEVGQTLLIDPYVKHETQKSQTTGVPILSSIPYISASFTNVETVTVQQHMVILVQPQIEAEPKSMLPR